MYCYFCMREVNGRGNICECCGKAFGADDNRSHLLAGTVLNHKYLVGNVLGQGGFGITYTGLDTTLDLRIAIKEYFPLGHASRDCLATNEVTLLTGPNEQYFASGKERFLTEAKTLAKFNRSGNIVHARDFFELNNTAYIIMDFVEGQDLKSYLREHGKMEPQYIVRWFLPILKVLAKVHDAGLIHRDISPDNIIVENGELVLIDFGAARHVDVSKSFSIMLKPGYAPCEQYSSDSSKQGPWTDIYEVCATLYECITGEVPQESSTRLFDDQLKKPSELGIRIPYQLENVLMHGMENRYADRPQNMYELIAELENALQITDSAQKTVLMDAPAPVPAAAPKKIIAEEPFYTEQSAPQTTYQPAGSNPAQNTVYPDITLRELSEAVSRHPDQITNGGYSIPLPELVSAVIQANTSPFVLRGSTLVRYSGTAQMVTIPQNVTAIGANAFENCSLLKHVIIPEGVTEIEELAFSNCSNLEIIQFPDSLQTIENQAFLNCFALQSAEFRGALSKIGSGTFEGCISLKSVIFDCPIEKIGYDAFAGCAELQKIKVSARSYAYKTVDGVLFDFEGKYLIRYPAGRNQADYIVPDTVFAIEDGAFSGSRIERISFSKNVKKIGTAAFRECKKLWQIIFSENLETVKTAAFQGCTGLKTVTLPEKLTHLGTYVFSHCDQLENVMLPEKMNELGKGVFEYCEALKLIELPERLLKIGEKAFQHSGLQEIFIPYFTTKIEKHAFAFCAHLRSVFLSNRVSLIAPAAFEQCPPDFTIYGMSDSAAEQFAFRTKIPFEEMFTLTAAASGQCALRDYRGNFSLVLIPPEVTAICDKAFFGCDTLQTVIIPAGVGEIGKKAFADCKNLLSVTMTNLIRRIGDRAFENCCRLEEFQVLDKSLAYDPKEQRRIHRSFYKALQTIRSDLAEAYAQQYNVTAKNSLFG